MNTLLLLTLSFCLNHSDSSKTNDNIKHYHVIKKEKIEMKNNIISKKIVMVRMKK